LIALNIVRAALWATRLASLGLIVWADVASAAISLPQINTNNILNITNYGANVTNADNATAIQNAINAAAAGGTTNGLNGGTVRIPAGTNAYLSGPLTFKSYVNFQIDAGAILRMLPIDQYPGGIVNPSDFITGSSLHDIEISGSGAIDGQGAPWWPGYKTNSRPTMIYFGSCSKVLLQNTTFSNSPAQFIGIKGNNAGNVTIQGITVKAPPSIGVAYPSHNTDAIDLAETNAVIQNCYLDTGDDNIAIGSSAGLSRDILVTNCFFGEGHGCSIGSYTSSGVSNLTVINCTFSNTDNGIRIKSDNDRGGTVQNLNYLNLTMTNVNFPFCIYAYYNSVGTPSSISPNQAAAQTVAAVTGTTPIYRNLTFSNITAYSVSGYPVGIIWARTEMPATNLVFNKVTLAGDRNFCLYNVSGAQFIDCDINTSATSNSFALFNAQVIITNSAPTNNLFTFDGVTTNGYSNSLKFYNALGSLKNTNVFDDGPLTLSASTLTVSNNLTLFPTTVLNYVLSTNTTKLAVVGNLRLGGTNNLSAGPGFTNGAYTLITYTGNLNGSVPTLGATPGGAYTYALDTNTAHQVNLIVSPTCVHPTASVSGSGTICGGSSANIQAALTGTGPWSVTWSDGVVESGAASSPAMRSVSPAVTTNYTVNALSDSTGCSAGTLSGSATVTVNAHPTASVSGGGTICGGSSANIQAALTGMGPWNVTWSDGALQSGVASSPAMRSVSSAVTTNYTVNALSDSTGCSAGTLSGSATVTVNTHPAATVSGGGTICGGSSASIQAALTGTGPWNVTWSDGAVQSGVASSPVQRSVSPAVTTNYTLTALSDATGCTAGTLSGGAMVTVCTPAPFAITSLQFLAPDQLEISWSSVSNTAYQIQSKDSLNADSWVTNATVVAPDTTTSWTNTGVSNISQSFYRVVIGP
jgi:polygalacturonase